MKITLTPFFGSVLLLGLLFIQPTECAFAKTPTKSAFISTLTFEGGYNHPRRELYRTIYGGRLAFSMSYLRQFSNDWILDVNPSVTRNHRRKREDTFWDFSLNTTFNRMIRQTIQSEIRVGAGIGLSYRRLQFLTSMKDGAGIDMGGKFVQSELRPMLKIQITGDRKLSNIFLIGTKLSYVRHLFGDPTIGDFGDTGGFFLQARFGFWL